MSKGDKMRTDLLGVIENPEPPESFPITFHSKEGNIFSRLVVNPKDTEGEGLVDLLFKITTIIGIISSSSVTEES
jgi:hypothetical protein